jgi:hypothetical protein
MLGLVPFSFGDEKRKMIIHGWTPSVKGQSYQIRMLHHTAPIATPALWYWPVLWQNQDYGFMQEAV